MIIRNKEINVNDAINFVNYGELLIKHRNNGILLSDYQVNVLKKNGFDYKKYNSMQELLFEIEEYLNDEYDNELDLVSNQIAEVIYYRDTKKWELSFFSFFKYFSFLFDYMF